MSIRKYVKKILRKVKRWLDEEDQPRPAAEEIPSIEFDNREVWLRASWRKVMRDPVCSKRPQYIWGVLQGAALAKVLGIERVSVIEFGVAGGAGLLAMEQTAQHCEQLVNIKIDVYGFDTGMGYPKPQDYRDSPNLFAEGYYPSDLQELTRSLRRASLRLGPVKETMPSFVQSTPAPVAFVSFDVNFYYSTKEALALFEAAHSLLLPRIVCFFRGTLGKTFCDYTGERLAISEFNSEHAIKKICPIYGLRYFVPPEFSYWPEMFYWLHIFDHPLYNSPDAIQQSSLIDIQGNDIYKQVTTVRRSG